VSEHYWQQANLAGFSPRKLQGLRVLPRDRRPDEKDDRARIQEALAAADQIGATVYLAADTWEISGGPVVLK
jgi:hypothetical protein